MTLRPPSALAIVDHDFVGLLDDTWDVPGVYCLLYPVAEDGTFQIYVGKALEFLALWNHDLRMGGRNLENRRLT